MSAKLDLIREGYFRVIRENGTYLKENSKIVQFTTLEKASFAAALAKIEANDPQNYYVVPPNRWRTVVTNISTVTVSPTTGAVPKSNPGHYIAINLYGNRDTQITTAASKSGVAGVQVRIPWSTMETSEGVYDFTEVQSALDLVAPYDKQMVLFIFDKSFKNSDRYVPTYMRPTYELQTDRNLDSNGDPQGYIAKRWDPYVTERMIALMQAISDEFDTDPNFEGVAIQESAISILDPTLDANGYTPEAYRDELISMLNGGVAVFPLSRVFWYMNFIQNNQSYAADIADAVYPNGVWVGGPDILEGNNSLETHVYPVLRNLPDGVKFNSAQYDSFRHDYPTPPPDYYHPQNVFEYARDSLRVSYIFWNNPLSPSPSDSYDIDDAYPVMAANPDFAP